MAGSDGSVIIDTKLDTSGINKGAANMETQMEKMAVAAETTAKDIASSFSSIDVKNAADGMSESFSKESVEIEAILSNNEKSAKSKAASIAAVYKEQGLSQSDAMKKAWEHIERNSKTSSEKVEKTSKTSSKKIQKYIGDIGTKSKSVGKNVTSDLSNGISSVVKKIGVAIASAFTVRTIINFGKEAIELGSDLQEVQNVVDVTFTTMSDKVDEFAKQAAATAGLSETMAKKFAGTFGAMSKSFGFAESEALDMATSLTQLSGDVASFYNLTQEEAYTKLKSVFTGETESLKDLGVVMSQTALDSFALAKGYKKTTKAMTEQEKVALRYEFVMEQLSGASGDFLRTSDGWANQVRVLKLNVESFMATIGQGLINLFTPVIKLLNSLFASLQRVANGFKEWTEQITGKDSASEELSNAAESAGDVSTELEDAATSTKKIKNNLSGLDELKIWDSGDDSGVEELESAMSSIGDLSVSDLTVGVSGDGGSLFDPKTILKNIMEDIDELDFSVLGRKVSSAVTKGLEELKDFFVTLYFASITADLSEFIGNIEWDEVVTSAFDLGSSVSKAIVSLFEGVNGTSIGNAIGKLIVGFLENLPKAIETGFSNSLRLVVASISLLRDIVVGIFGGLFGTENIKDEWREPVEIEIEDTEGPPETVPDDGITEIKPEGDVIINTKEPVEITTEQEEPPPVVTDEDLEKIKELVSLYGNDYGLYRGLDYITGEDIDAWEQIRSAISSTAISKSPKDAEKYLKETLELVESIPESIGKIQKKAKIGKLLTSTSDRSFTDRDVIESLFGSIIDDKLVKIQDEELRKTLRTKIVGIIEDLGAENWSRFFYDFSKTMANYSAEDLVNPKIIESIISDLSNAGRFGALELIDEVEITMSAAASETGFGEGSQMGENLSSGLNGKKPLVLETAKGLVTAIGTEISGLSLEGNKAGDKMGQEIANGLDGKKPTVQASASGLIQTVATSVETASKGDVVKNALSRAVSTVSGMILSLFKSDKTKKETEKIGKEVGEAYSNGLGSTATSGLQTVVSKSLSKIGETLEDLSTIEIGGVKPFSFATSILSKFKVPLLAKGAVIPPNAPFAAILGDQTKGTNIEAPEALLRKIVREETATKESRGNTYNVTATAKGKVLFDLVLSEGRAELVRTGKNPFDLVKT